MVAQPDEAEEAVDPSISVVGGCQGLAAVEEEGEAREGPGGEGDGAGRGRGHRGVAARVLRRSGLVAFCSSFAARCTVPASGAENEWL